MMTQHRGQQITATGRSPPVTCSVQPVNGELVEICFLFSKCLHRVSNFALVLQTLNDSLAGPLWEKLADL